MAKRLKLEAAKQLKAMVYGQPGSGKTTFCGSAAEDDRTAPVLHLDVSGNPQSLVFNKNKPDIIQIEEMKDLSGIYNWLLGGQKLESPIVQKYELEPGYKTIVIDGLTEIQRIATNEVTGNNAKRPGEMPVAVQIQQHGVTLAQMTAIAKLFYNLPLHVIMTVLEKEVPDAATGVVSYSPLLTGQAAQQLPAYPTIVGRTIAKSDIDKRTARALSLPETGDYVLLLKSDGRYYAKNQSGAKADYLINPTVKQLLDLIEARVQGG